MIKGKIKASMKISSFAVSLLLMMTFGVTSAVAQEDLRLVRGDCTPARQASSELHKDNLPVFLSAVNKNWDATKVYRQLVVLFEYSDLSFAEGRDRDFYDRLFNNFDTSLFEGRSRSGIGSVADYFRDQSGGLLNLQFDVFGPYQVDAVARPTQSRDHKSSAIRAAMEKMIEANPGYDFSPYDWDGDGRVNQVVFICAGPTGNVTQGGVSYVGYLHPNTSTFSTITAPDGKMISNYSASAECWPTSSRTNCGIGTICHEFSHSLGLPDIYSTGSSEDSFLDTWDLMDGGPVVNYGWLPPNYTPLEKELLGWADYEELSEAETVTDLAPGKSYVIKKTDSDFYLLECRQQSKWDLGLPGKGLLIYHVLYDASSWSNNKVNSSTKRFTLVHADGMDYKAWLDYLDTSGLATWANTMGSNMMNSRLLSTSSFPYGDVQSFTDVAEKPVTNIKLSDDGLVSFDFKGGVPSAISTIDVDKMTAGSLVYDLSGRVVGNMQKGRIYIVRRSDGRMCKIVAD